MSTAWEQALNGLKDPDPLTRLQHIASLQAFGQYEAIPALVDCLKQDPDPEVRKQAGQAARWLTEHRSHPRDPYGIFGL